mmetsp:Transcript_1461/g.3926  ORF Transcript_1461/g.3926 Transcript_1461/m.3926 type:complete len:84 (+) Transcript_1461:212-463(+)
MMKPPTTYTKSIQAASSSCKHGNRMNSAAEHRIDSTMYCAKRTKQGRLSDNSFQRAVQKNETGRQKSSAAVFGVFKKSEFKSL